MLLIQIVLMFCAVTLDARRRGLKYANNQLKMFVYFTSCHISAIVIACAYYILQQLAAHNKKLVTPNIWNAIIDDKYLFLLCGLAMCAVVSRILHNKLVQGTKMHGWMDKWAGPWMFALISISPIHAAVIYTVILIVDYIRTRVLQPPIDIIASLVMAVGTYGIMPIISALAMRQDITTYMRVYMLIYVAVVTVFSFCVPVINGAKNNTAD